MTKSRKIILVGPMGAGKTSLGKRLAHKINYHFFDTDHKIVEDTGVSIPFIFEKEGESGFRVRELEALKALVAFPGNAVIACGGGIVLGKENREIIMRQDVIVFLDVSVDRQLKRISADSNRPLAQAKDKRQRLQSLRDDRLGLYEGIADFRINTDDNIFASTLKKLCNRVLQQINKNGM